MAWNTLSQRLSGSSALIERMRTLIARRLVSLVRVARRRCASVHPVNVVFYFPRFNVFSV